MPEPESTKITIDTRNPDKWLFMHTEARHIWKWVESKFKCVIFKCVNTVPQLLTAGGICFQQAGVELDETDSTTPHLMPDLVTRGLSSCFGDEPDSEPENETVNNQVDLGPNEFCRCVELFGEPCGECGYCKICDKQVNGNLFDDHHWHRHYLGSREWQGVQEAKRLRAERLARDAVVAAAGEEETPEPEPEPDIPPAPLVPEEPQEFVGQHSLWD